MHSINTCSLFLNPNQNGKSYSRCRSRIVQNQVAKSETDEIGVGVIHGKYHTINPYHVSNAISLPKTLDPFP